jgi:hypothetical protein
MSERTTILRWRAAWNRILAQHRGNAWEARRDLRDRLAIVVGARFPTRDRAASLDGLAALVVFLGTAAKPIKQGRRLLGTMRRRVRPLLAARAAKARARRTRARA